MKKTLIGIELTAVALLVMMVFLLFKMNAGGNVRLNSDSIHASVSIVGEYSVDDGQWKTFSPDAAFDMTARHTVRFRGNFSGDIPKNMQVMLRIADLKVRLSVNGKPIYSFDRGGQNDRLIRTGGNVWDSFTSPGIKKTDLIEIEVSNVYTNLHPLSFNEFFNQIRYGAMAWLYREMLLKYGVAVLLGLMILMVGVVELIAAAELTILHQKHVRRIYYNAGLSISCGIWFCIQYEVISLLMPFPSIVATLDMCCFYLIGIFCNLFITSYLNGWRRIIGLSLTGINIIWALCAVSFQALGIMDLYDTLPIGSILLVICLLASMGVFLYECIQASDRLMWIAFLSLAAAITGGTLDAFFYWFRIANQTEWSRASYAIFVLTQLVILVYEFKRTGEQAKHAKQLEYDMLQKDVAIMLSQIKPHFLYNALNTIQYLCETEPETAARAIDDFSHYLRGNMDSLTRKEPIPFRLELGHLQNYLAIEKLRFDQVSIVYDFQVTEFKLPPLTLQPLVENAIRHGVTRKPGGGTVTLSTREDEANRIIQIRDDGVGFDPEQEKHDGRSHIGITCTRERLASLCRGKLKVDSRPGEGTTVTIILPKEEQEHAGNCH